MSPDLFFASVVRILYPDIKWSDWKIEVTRNGGCRFSCPDILGTINVSPQGVHFGALTQAIHPALGQVATWEQIEAYCAELRENAVSPSQQRIQESVKALRAAGLNELANLVASAPEGRANALAREVSQLVSPSGQRLTFG